MMPYLSASGLAKHNYPKLQPEIPQPTESEVSKAYSATDPKKYGHGCVARLKQNPAQQNIVQVIKEYTYTFNEPHAHWDKFYSNSRLVSAQWMHPPPSGILSQVRMVHGNKDMLKSFETNCQCSMLVHAFRFGLAISSVFARLERPKPNTLFSQLPSLPSGTSEARRQVAFLAGLGTCIRQFNNSQTMPTRYKVSRFHHSTLCWVYPLNKAILGHNHGQLRMFIAASSCSESAMHSDV